MSYIFNTFISKKHVEHIKNIDDIQFFIVHLMNMQLISNFIKIQTFNFCKNWFPYFLVYYNIQSFWFIKSNNP